MKKAYLKYQPQAVLGQVYGSSNIEFDNSGKICYAGANEEVIAMNILEGKISGKYIASDSSHEEVSAVACGNIRSILAVGYKDGSVIVYDIASYQILHKFSLHSSEVTVLTFDFDVFPIF